VVLDFINDPFCTIPRSVDFFLEFLYGIKEVHKKENIEKIPKTHPFLSSPATRTLWATGEVTFRLLHGFMEKTGIKDVTYKLYKDARHELVNELNRDEVINDIIMWMNKRNPSA